jgi:hypothetical protein
MFVLAWLRVMTKSMTWCRRSFWQLSGNLSVVEPRLGLERVGGRGSKGEARVEAEVEGWF